jgi:hypothetical protein
MAVFGFQLVLTMIVASFLQKLSPYYSFGRWLVTWGLQRYLPPSDKLLRPHISTPTPANKVGKKKAANHREKVLASPNSTSEEIIAALTSDPNALDLNLAVPKSASIKLTSSPLRWGDVDILHFSAELEFMLNMTLAATIVVGATILYYSLWPRPENTEYNLSVIWLVIVIGYAFKALFSLTKIYLSEEMAHQRSLVIVFTTLLFVLSLGVLLVDESVLDFGLERSHQNITRTVSVIFKAVVKDGTDFKLLPMWGFKILLALLSSVLSMVLIFPGFRFADTHFTTIYHSRMPIFKTFLHANYIAPMFCLVLWIRPLSLSIIAERSNVNVFGVAEISYDAFRLCVLLGVCLLRLALFRSYLQSYLDTARWRVENLRQEPGRITIFQLRKKVSHIFSFYAALGIEYIAPYIILFSVTLLIHVCHPLDAPTIDLEKSESNIFRSSGFGIGMFHGCLAFICWWVCFTNAVASGFGAVLKEFI